MNITSYNATIWQDESNVAPGKFRISVSYTYADEHDIFHYGKVSFGEGVCHSLLANGPQGIDVFDTLEEAEEALFNAYPGMKNCGSTNPKYHHYLRLEGHPRVEALER